MSTFRRPTISRSGTRTSRRRVLVRVDEGAVITRVKAVAGEVLSEFDTTGTLTGKYQAKCRSPVAGSVLVSAADTARVREFGPGGNSAALDLLPIAEVYGRLVTLIGSVVPMVGRDQERNPGGGLHREVCRCLGLAGFADSGQFPDVPSQLLEVKLQTSPTIDLGLVSPDDTGPISDIPGFRHCDVRYAVYYGTAVGRGVRLDSLLLATGEDFFGSFQRFEGRVVNRKLQLHLPCGFFD